MARDGADAQIEYLDEPTSSLDLRNEHRRLNRPGDDENTYKESAGTYIQTGVFADAFRRPGQIRVARSLE